MCICEYMHICMHLCVFGYVYIIINAKVYVCIYILQLLGQPVIRAQRAHTHCTAGLGTHRPARGRTGLRTGVNGRGRRQLPSLGPPSRKEMALLLPHVAAPGTTSSLSVHRGGAPSSQSLGGLDTSGIFGKTREAHRSPPRRPPCPQRRKAGFQKRTPQVVVLFTPVLPTCDAVPRAGFHERVRKG